MTKTKVAVAMGGYSSEKEISLKSGQVVYDSLNKDIYDIYKVEILEEGWYYISNSGEKVPINKSNFSFYDVGIEVIPDVVFNTIHGTPGEDGYLAAYWELLNIPQTSTHFYAAALSFNKRDCLSVLKNFNVNCANSVYLNDDSSVESDAIIKKVGLPCFVKPNRAGSSFGISKVNNFDELEGALEKAFKEDSQVLIETALVGPEVSVGVYKNRNDIVVLPPTEIVSENDFFDYDAKYLGKSEEITPARLSKEITLKVQNEAKRIYKLLGMEGISRIDFIIQQDEPYFIEINSTPGLSKESIVPQQVRETGMELPMFFQILIENTLAKK